MSFTVKDLMLVRETDPKRMGGFSINNGHLQCVVDPQGVGIRNKLSNIDLCSFLKKVDSVSVTLLLILLNVDSNL